MADTKISALTSGNPAQSGDEIPIARTGANYKITAGSIAALASVSPAGSDTYVQFNDAGSFGADAGLAYNKTTNTLSTERVNLGTAGAASGILTLSGSTSGTVTLQPAAAAGTYTLTLPTSDGNSGEVLTTDGSGVLSWAASAGGSPGGSTTQLQYNNAGSFGGTSGITTTGTELTIASGTKTASAPVLDITQTWNNAAVTFTGLKLNVTNTASASASLLADLQVGGSSKFKVDRDGYAYTSRIVSSSGTSVLVYDQFGNQALDINTYYLKIGVSASNVSLYPDAANTLAQRNGTNAQTLRVYNTYTDASNYERAKIAWDTNVLKIGTEKLGTGTARALELQTDGTTRLTLAANGGISFTIASGQAVSLNANRVFNYAAGSAEGVSFGNYTGGHGFITGPNAQVSFAPVTAFNGNPDVGFQRHAANVVKVTNGSTGVGVIQTPATTVAALPAAATAGAGARSFVTDATATTFLSTVAGGGANAVPVVSDGTNWLIG